MRFLVATLIGTSILSGCVRGQVTATAAATPTRIATSTIASNQPYFVDGSYGSDSYPGTQAQPWKTIQKAANTLIAGQTVIVQAGTYPERIQVAKSGAASAPITFQANGTVVMSGFTVKADYISIQGFEITNTPDNSVNGIGIFVQGSYCDLENNYVHFATRGGITLFAQPGSPSQTSNCTVRNNRLYRNASHGIEVSGQNHLVEGNEIWGTIQYHPNWTNPPSTVDADGIRFFGSGHVFRNNYIHDISLDDPENINPHIDAFQTWDQDAIPAGNNCIFESNRIALGRGTAGFQLEGGAHDLMIRNNIVQAAAGIRAYKITQSPFTSPSNLFVLNNLFIGNLAFTASDGHVGVTLEDTTVAVAKNNIFLNQPAKVIDISASSGIDVSYNMAYNSDGSIPAFPIGTSTLQVLWGIDPLFVNSAAGDYHLKAGSPAIDAGSSTQSVPNDFDRISRPRSAGFDIGPFEYTP